MNRKDRHEQKRQELAGKKVCTGMKELYSKTILQKTEKEFSGKKANFVQERKACKEKEQNIQDKKKEIFRKEMNIQERGSFWASTGKKSMSRFLLKHRSDKNNLEDVQHRRDKPESLLNG